MAGARDMADARSRAANVLQSFQQAVLQTSGQVGTDSRLVLLAFVGVLLSTSVIVNLHSRVPSQVQLKCCATVAAVTGFSQSLLSVLSLMLEKLSSLIQCSQNFASVVLCIMMSGLLRALQTLHHTCTSLHAVFDCFQPFRQGSSQRAWCIERQG